MKTARPYYFDNPSRRDLGFQLYDQYRRQDTILKFVLSKSSKKIGMLSGLLLIGKLLKKDSVVLSFLV